jgi:hypothetical protein
MFVFPVFAENTPFGVSDLNQMLVVKSCQTYNRTTDGLRIVVRRAAASLRQLEVIFGNGESRTLNLDGILRQPGDRTLSYRWNTQRCVRSVRVLGRSEINQRGEMARVGIVGLNSLQRRNPQNRNAHLRNLIQGQRVYNLDRTAYASVLGPDSRNPGRFLLRFLTGELRGRVGGNWSREKLAVTSGCNREYCVGNRVWNVDRNAWAQIEALQYSNEFVLTFTSGELRGKTGRFWDDYQIAVTQGCREFCVGERVFNLDRNAYAQIVGIELVSGTYVLTFITGPLSGQTGDSWRTTSLRRAED